MRFDNADPIDVGWAILNQVQESPAATAPGLLPFRSDGGDHVTGIDRPVAGPSRATPTRDAKAAPDFSSDAPRNLTEHPEHGAD